jgi:hypothetical protein
MLWGKVDFKWMFEKLGAYKMRGRVKCKSVRVMERGGLLVAPPLTPTKLSPLYSATLHRESGLLSTTSYLVYVISN